MTEEMKSAVYAWKALTNEQQMEFVAMFERDIRDCLVCVGTLEPMVSPPLDECE
jgi:hypothetical protein